MSYDYHGMFYLMINLEIFFSIVGKWDQATGINSPLYRSHLEVNDHEEWKNAVREKKKKMN
jgi:hypothetical protein